MFCVAGGEEDWRRQLAEMLELTASQIQLETSVSNMEGTICFRLTLIMAGTEGDPSLWL